MHQPNPSLQFVVRRHAQELIVPTFSSRELVIAPNKNLKIDVYKTTPNLAFLHVKTHAKHKLRVHKPNASLQFVVRRHAPELIPPAIPTPREVKPLSDIDDQIGLRYRVPMIFIYERDPKMGDTNPAKVIREALAKFLVFYYPLAGRLKEGPVDKLMVDCTGEGVMFIEAEADVTLKQFREGQLGEVFHPPFPCFEELLYDVPGCNGIFDSPLLHIQVTRMSCGGFIFASRFTHCMCDGAGYIQFMEMLCEIARGASAPSKLHVWKRELLFARDPPRVTFNHREYDEITITKWIKVMMTIMMTKNKMHQKTFFFGSTDLAAIRRFVPENVKGCSNFQMLAAVFWRCRTMALDPYPKEEVRFMFPVDVRRIIKHKFPVGYYGNCFVNKCATTTAQDLIDKPLGHAIELVITAKALVSEEYVRSTTDLLVAKGRPVLNLDRSYFISDISSFNKHDFDFGWGKAVFGGTANTGLDFLPGILSYYMSYTNKKGESGIMIPLVLPAATMEKFEKELNILLM